MVVVHFRYIKRVTDKYLYICMYVCVNTFSGYVHVITFTDYWPFHFPCSCYDCESLCMYPYISFLIAHVLPPRTRFPLAIPGSLSGPELPVIILITLLVCSSKSPCKLPYYLFQG